jgi:hypothetical protein
LGSVYQLEKGRLAQRLERSVYTRKVIRSNRILPTIRAQYPSAGT